jgi:hypothetical protein
MRERFCGEWWTLNMVVSKVGGILIKLMFCMGLVFGNSPGGVGRIFQSIQDLRWVAVQKLVFGMMSGVGNNPLR